MTKEWYVVGGRSVCSFIDSSPGKQNYNGNKNGNMVGKKDVSNIIDWPGFVAVVK
jgi:hypothetical protein